MSYSTNPTANIELNFERYLEIRQKGQTITGVTRTATPDYAFPLDSQLQQQLASIRPLRPLIQMVISTAVSIDQQTQFMDGLLIGSNQYPEVYKIAEECAARLELPTPKVFVMFSPIVGGYTLLTDNTEPFIIISNGLLEALTPEELAFFIGHECGHIHNGHGVYNTAVAILTNPLAKSVLQSLAAIGGFIDSLKYVTAAIQGSLRLVLVRWGRAAQINCDRAGVFCCNDIKAAQYALIKMMSGGAAKREGINIDAYLAQFENLQPTTSSRLLEFGQMHVPLPRRIEAIRFFGDSMLFDKGQLSKEALDSHCEQLLSI